MVEAPLMPLPSRHSRRMVSPATTMETMLQMMSPTIRPSECLNMKTKEKMVMRTMSTVTPMERAKETLQSNKQTDKHVNVKWIKFIYLF